MRTLSKAPENRPFMKLDFLIAGSLTPSFLSQIAFFRLCLDHLGGVCQQARVVAVFGDHTTTKLPTRWARHYHNIEVVWAHPVGAHNPGYQAQHLRRFEIMREDADLVFICDADTAFLRTPDMLIRLLMERPALAGVIAHYPFTFKRRSFPWLARRFSERHWARLATATIGKPMAMPHRYSLLPDEAKLRAPFYINYGLLAGTPELLAQFYHRDLQLQNQASEQVGPFWGPQVSLALTCADLGLPTVALPMRYNFPNDEVADRLHADELQQVVMMHYLRVTHFRRDQIFAEKENFDRFLKLELSGSNRVFQDHVALVTGGAYPFA